MARLRIGERIRVSGSFSETLDGATGSLARTEHFAFGTDVTIHFDERTLIFSDDESPSRKFTHSEHNFERIAEHPTATPSTAAIAGSDVLANRPAMPASDDQRRALLDEIADVQSLVQAVQGAADNRSVMTALERASMAREDACSRLGQHCFQR